MGYIVRMPKLGMEMQEGELLEWNVAVGDRVTEGDVVAEIESEKSVADVEAREDGVLRERLLDPGDAVEPGAPMGIVADPEEDITGLRGEAGIAEPAADAATAADDRAAAAASAADAPADTDGDGATATAGDGRVRASPRARRLAEERGVDLATVAGSGPGGAVVAADVEAADAATVDTDGETAVDAGDETAATTGDAASSTRADADGSAGDGSVQASPRARQLAVEHGVDLSELSGSGPGGAIVADDVEAAAAGADAESAAEAATGTEPAGGDTAATAAGATETAGTGTATETASTATDRTVREHNEFGGMRRTIAERLGESYRNAVHVTVDREVDVEALLHATEVADDALDADVSMPDLLLVALSEALSAHPDFNATYEDGVHTVYEDQHVGIAVDVDAGLVTPVLRGLDGLTLPEIARERRRLTDLALDGEYTTEDLSRGTFTVSNLGVLGVDSFTPIINPPEVAIMGINRVREVPRPAEGGGVEFRRRMTVSLSFDHRVVDGADAARFLETFASAVESPWSALLERT